MDKSYEVHLQEVSQETKEWQDMARKEKHHVEYAESSHFSMVSIQSEMF